MGNHSWTMLASTLYECEICKVRKYFPPGYNNTEKRYWPEHNMEAATNIEPPCFPLRELTQKIQERLNGKS
jgi:hypothetical protein